MTARSVAGYGSTGGDAAVDRAARGGHMEPDTTARRNEAPPLPTLRDRLAHIFTWWNGHTVGTAFFTARHGERVGADEFGNVYYRSIGGRIDPALGHERRWVIYNGYSEASTVPTGWYGWLNHTSAIPPTEEAYTPKPWQKPHLPNMTGTPQAWRPPGSTLRANARPPATGDYEAWSPEG